MRLNEVIVLANLKTCMRLPLLACHLVMFRALVNFFGYIVILDRQLAGLCCSVFSITFIFFVCILLPWALVLISLEFWDLHFLALIQQMFRFVSWAAVVVGLKKVVLFVSFFVTFEEATPSEVLKVLQGMGRAGCFGKGMHGRRPRYC